MTVRLEAHAARFTFRHELRFCGGSVRGEATVEASRVGLDGAAPKFHVNPTYLADALEHVPGPTVYVRDALQPLTVLPQADGVRDLAVVMPRCP